MRVRVRDHWSETAWGKREREGATRLMGSGMTHVWHESAMSHRAHLHDEVEQREGDVEGGQEDHEEVGDVLLGAGGIQADLQGTANRGVMVVNW